MKFIDEFRDKDLAKGLLQNIEKTSTRPVQLMEVCGTHTVSIFRYGIRGLLPEHVKLLSGPGCPVCVTPNQDIDLAIALSRQKDVMIVTFGDMMKVPGSTSSLQKEKAEGKDIRIIYSSLEAIRIAQKNPDKKVIFLAIGFETTSPTIAVAILRSKEEKIKNLFFLNSQKRIPPALYALLQSEKLNVDGFILPGHVSAILGITPYQFIAKDFGRPAVITGFEPLDILQGVWMLIRQIEEGRAVIDNQYGRIVQENGNPLAMQKIDEVFVHDHAQWRGLGTIPDSGYRFKELYAEMDAANFDVEVEPPREHPQCLCGEVLQGIKTPVECRLFKTACHPENPIGPCMVSMEGTCHAYFKFS
ncbi:MAG: hydrogenase formation protein HypD [Syntrophaceae bacterium]|nr:hydrogenase formation protein HypD [Syntrophaceae bacterium]